VIAGAIPLAEYMHPKNLMRLIGMRGMAKAI
jgi:hypothetical protein